MTVDIYHNPKCSKSRETLKLLEDNGHEPNVIEYLKTPPDFFEMKAILKGLGMTPRELMRKNEAPYKELGLDDPSLDDDTLIRAMVENPILIERPIVANDDKLALGRPPEAVLKLF